MDTKSTVLLVDDNPISLEAMQLLFAGTDYELLLAGDGKEAISKASEHLPDLILLDVLLPEIDGFEVCRRIRADEELADVPIIMLTALVDKRFRLQGIEVGADDFITKPFNTDELKARVRNITRLNRYRRIKDERYRFEQLVRLSPDGILIVDQEGKVRHANSALSDLLKVKNNHNLTGEKIQSLVPDDLINRVLHGLERVDRNSTQSIRLLAVLVDKSGEHIPVELNCQMIEWENQDCVLAVIRDYSEHEHLLDRIRRGVEDWQATFDAVQDIMILTDLNGKVIRCNRITLDYFNAGFSDLIDRNIRDLLFNSTDLSMDIMNLKGEIQFPTLDGWFEITSYPVPRSANVEKYIFSIRDITLAKEIEEKVAASQRLTDLGILAAGVTHDIKSPLQVITGRVESLLNRLATDEPIDKETLIHSLENVNRNAWRIENVMRSLLNYAHQNCDGTDLYDINEMVRDSLVLIEHQLMTWANIDISVDLFPDIPLIECEQNKMSQVLVNLLMNARDAMPSGGTITIRTIYDEKENNIILQVIDTGIGISNDIKERIFDPFFTTKPIGHGTGLGLSNVKKIVEGCRGNIHVKDKPGGGTIFSLIFPNT